MRPELNRLPEMSAPQAYWRGVMTTLVVALPVAILNQLLVSGGDLDARSPVVILFWILIMFGAAGGGWAVRRLSPTAHLAWSAGAAATAYVLVQGIGVLRRLISGERINWVGYPFLALLMACCGILGAIYAGRITRRYGDGDGTRSTHG